MEEAVEEYQMSMSRYMIICLVFFLLTGCSSSTQEKSIAKENISTDKKAALVDSLIETKPPETILKESNNNVFPDTTINKKLYLEDYNTASDFYTGIENIELIDKIRSSPIALFVNKKGREYLMAYQYEGSTQNSFSCFEIGYIGGLDLAGNKTEEEKFKTESGLELGLLLKDVVAKKGNDYTKKIKGDETILTYRINNIRTSSFLKRYNMPGYFIEITLKADKVFKILFGFDYP